MLSCDAAAQIHAKGDVDSIWLIMSAMGETLSEGGGYNEPQVGHLLTRLQECTFKFLLRPVSDGSGNWHSHE